MVHVVRGLRGRDAVLRGGAQAEALDAAPVVRHAEPAWPGRGTPVEKRGEEETSREGGLEDNVPGRWRWRTKHEGSGSAGRRERGREREERQLTCGMPEQVQKHLGVERR